MAETNNFETSQLVNNLYNILYWHKKSLLALELTDKNTAYLTLVEKTLSEIYGLELFLSPLLENEEGYIIEPLQ